MGEVLGNSENINVSFGLANVLTLTRIAAVPAVVGFLYAAHILDSALLRGLTLCLYIVACLTDYLDGYIARERDEVSSFGQFCDPVADKLLIAVLILVLVAIDRIQGLNLLPAIVILGREMIVSSLRGFLTQNKVPLPVSALAKWKTATQMIGLGALIVTDHTMQVPVLSLVGDAILWIAALLSMISCYQYFRVGMKLLRAKNI